MGKKQLRRNTSTSSVEYDAVFEYVSSFGPYQKALYIAVNGLILPICLQFGNLLFSFGTPKFHCDAANTTCSHNKCCHNCTSYSFDGPFSSIVVEWNLVCDRGYFAATTQSVFFVGMMVGSIASGILSDALGRRVSMGLNAAIMIASSFGSSFAGSYTLLTLLQFFVGASLTGSMLSVYTYGMEIIGPNKRTLAGNANEAFWTVGNILIVLIAYFLREWRLFMRVTSLPAIPFLLFWRYLPETPRWLIAHGRLEEAHTVLMKYGANAKTSSLNQEVLRNVIKKIRDNQLKREQETKKYNIFDLFRTSKIRKWTFVLGFNWFVIALSNFGFILYSTALAGNFYVNFTLLMVVVPALQIAPVWFLLHKFGRRIPHFTILLSAGIVCLVILFIPEEYSIVLTGISVAGRSLISSGWTTVYLITSELYPTILRNTALGMCSFCGRIGAMIAPYVVMTAQLQGLSTTLPVTIFGAAAILASITSLWIPETHYETMPQTIVEAETRKDYYGIPCYRKPPEENEDEAHALTTMENEDEAHALTTMENEDEAHALTTMENEDEAHALTTMENEDEAHPATSVCLVLESSV